MINGSKEVGIIERKIVTRKLGPQHTSKTTVQTIKIKVGVSGSFQDAPDKSIQTRDLFSYSQSRADKAEGVQHHCLGDPSFSEMGSTLGRKA
jgi:hypothetical protein